MYKTLQPALQKELAAIKEAGLYKEERVITTPQGADIKVSTGEEVINFCANNYLGLSSHPKVTEAAKKQLIHMDMECHQYVLFVEHRIFTKSWKQKFLNF
ncbi:hypothetical protein [Sphingobacterium sp. IITKGP-BTPF85]|uniref:hypothetical protein n=1 Tax=Sphingobacterium sp. IITKGP-BTPF85 TaxID=1338009 RepID=UPI0003F63320